MGIPYVHWPVSPAYLVRERLMIYSISKKLKSLTLEDWQLKLFFGLQIHDHVFANIPVHICVTAHINIHTCTQAIITLKNKLIFWGSLMDLSMKSSSPEILFNSNFLIIHSVFLLVLLNFTKDLKCLNVHFLT